MHTHYSCMNTVWWQTSCLGSQKKRNTTKMGGEEFGLDSAVFVPLHQQLPCKSGYPYLRAP